MRQNGLSVLLIFVLSASTWAQQDISIHFAPKPVIIDGHLEEWQLPLEIKHTSSPFYRNQVLCGLYWDYEYLLAAFKVSDSQLCVNATGNNNTRLYLNDAIEMYIDCKNDSQDKMDLNDYQILISLTGEKTIFKGDKQQIQRGSHVPKDHEGTNIVIQTKSNINGTINDATDKDIEYTLEIAVPWSAIGIIPKEGFEFRIDLCNNDIDTTADMRSWADNYHPPSMNFVNVSGKSDFGFPDDWQSVRLMGSPDWKYSLYRTYQSSPFVLKFSFGILVLGLFAGLWYQHSQLRFFRNFPSKKQNAKLTGTDLDEPEPVATINKEVALTKEITHVKSYIQRHIDKDIPVEKLAAEINVSVRQLQRILKTELHLTPKQYITILKLEKAEEMLHQGQWTVSEVAFQCGFADPSYFGAVFKKYFGQSPAEYRKTIL
ncbi:MAG: helix-turn-helix domain-containing protein [Saprospiraceae bacterium]|nr:helix-turn-helix domain-containing protein [Saprospiraceae bacterium]MBK8369815.1 helix-turn-helix domain-containing protein [Saprospiraceae bacterium]